MRDFSSHHSRKGPHDRELIGPCSDPTAREAMSNADGGSARKVGRRDLPRLVEKLGLTSLERVVPEPAPMLAAPLVAPAGWHVVVEAVGGELKKLTEMLGSRLSSAAARVGEMLTQLAEEDEHNPSPRETYRRAAVETGKLSRQRYVWSEPENRQPWLPGYMRQKARGVGSISGSSSGSTR